MQKGGQTFNERLLARYRGKTGLKENNQNMRSVAVGGGKGPCEKWEPIQ